MLVTARCQDCSQSLEGKSGPMSSLSSKDRRASGRRDGRPSLYTSKIYEPLTQMRGFIRVLNLRASSFENPVVDCELVVVPFNKETELQQHYEALSWCWGKAQATEHINIRKKGKVYAKPVPLELLEALKALRYTEEDRYLWIDAICINQENFQEKNHQVEMMAEIYGRADQVCIWLGVGDTSSRVALKFIREEVLQLQNFDELCESELASEKWKALLDLMQRPWFSRRWVVQEIALAQNAVVYCGTDEISWNKFAVAVELFVEVETATHRLSEVMKKDPKFYHVPGWFEYVSALGASLLVEATGKLFRDYKPNEVQQRLELQSESESESELDYDTETPPSSEADTDAASELSSKSSIKKLKPVSKGQPLLTLEYLVSSLSVFEVTIAHDAVYALLAISKDTIPYASDDTVRLVRDRTQEALEIFTQKKRYKVDYEQSYSDLCKEFVLFCITRSDPTRALDIICRPWAPEPGKDSKKRASRLRKRTTVSSSHNSPTRDRSGASSEGRKNKRGSPRGSARGSDQDKSELTFAQRRKVEDRMPLPSWIPRLKGTAYAMLPQAGAHTLKMGRKNADTLVGLPSSGQTLQRNYNAAETRGIDFKTFQFRKRPSMMHHSMYVQGFMLDTIQEVLPSSQGGAIPSIWARAGGWHNVPFSDPPDEFWRTLVADRGRDGRNVPVYYSRACKESFIKGSFASGSINTTDLINNERCSVVAQFCRRVQAVIWNRRLVKTQSGRLGLASQHTKKKDVICILYGCSVPVVLRRRWKTVGMVEQEVEEDVCHWKEEFVATWRSVCRSCRNTRMRRAWLRVKWWLWNRKMEILWRKDEDWQSEWGEIVSRRVQEQQPRELADKDEVTFAIKKEKEPMGYFLRGRKEVRDASDESKTVIEEESEEDYKKRLEAKSFRFWKERRKAAEIERTQTWNEPSPRWREFEIYLRCGRLWKAIWLTRRKLREARKQLKDLELSQKVSSNRQQAVEKPIRIPTARPFTERRSGDGHNTTVNGVSNHTQDPEDGENNEDNPPDNDYEEALKERFTAKFKAAGADDDLRCPKRNFTARDPEDVQRLQQNWCYYEVLGECYAHGMMDGQAMAYQNKHEIPALLFELR